MKYRYRIKANTTKILDTQANYMIKRVKNVIKNMVPMFKLQNNHFGKYESWQGILAAEIFSI